MAGATSFSSASDMAVECSSIQCSQLSAIIDQRQVQYARLVKSDSGAASVDNHPLLVPLQKRRARGHWISTDCASLNVRYERSSIGEERAVIEVDFRCMTLEKHFLSRMHFSHPQVECPSGVPARGSRFIVVSYKDGLGQIQKFVLGFSTFQEAEKFIDIVKVNFSNGIAMPLQSSNFEPQSSSQAEEVYRPLLDWETSTSVDVITQEMLPCPELNLAQHTISNEPVKDHEADGTMVSFPPDFTELLKGCQLKAFEETPKDTGYHLKSQLMHFLQGTSFKELLATVENVIDQLGDGSSLTF